MFLLPVSSQKSSKNSSKTVKNRLPDTSDNFSLVFPSPDPQKRENTSSRVKDFGGGSAAPRAPSIAKASCKLCSHTASIAGINGLTPWCRRPLFTWSFGESFSFARTNHASSFLGFNISTKPSVTKPPTRKGSAAPRR